MSTTPVCVTRRQWLELPVEYKAQQGGCRYIVVDGRRVPVVFVRDPKD